MANPQHIEWLLEGVEAWNRRREANDSIRPNFIKANLYEEFEKAGKVGADGYIPLDGANLEYADFRMAILQKPGLDDNPCGRPFQGSVSLQGANLHMANLCGAQLQKARLNRADMTESIVEKAQLDGAFLNEACLRSCYLSSTVLPYADLTGADLSNADLSGAILWDAKLSGAILAGSEPWKAHFYGSSEWQSAKQLTSSNLDNGESCNIENILTSIRRLKHCYAQHQSQWSMDFTVPLFDSVQLYFRGHAKSEWDLIPYAMRQEATKNNEEAMLLELNARRPEEFSHADSALAQWVLAQHHGLPTRFLDVTKNPLVALFHACEQHHGEDGTLHIFVVQPDLVQTYNSDIVSVVANFARLGRREQVALLGKREDSSDGIQPSGYQSAMTQLRRLLREEKPYFEDPIDVRQLLGVFVVEPQQSAERIRAQSGAFLLSAFHERFEREEILNVHQQGDGPPIGQGIPIYAHYTITVPSDAKRGIMSDLEMLNVTRETLFPGLDSSATAVKNLFMEADDQML